MSVWSCFGRCDSNEISDWKFPYKRSYHPVCVFAGRSKAVAMLRNCHPQASPETRRYEYMEATGCHCQVSFILDRNLLNSVNIIKSHSSKKTCSSMDTSCEAPNNFRDETSVKVLALAGPSPEDLDY